MRRSLLQILVFLALISIHARVVRAETRVGVMPVVTARDGVADVGYLSVVTPRVDSPYFNKAWRDSVNNYKFRLEAYHQEFYSYDWAMLFSFLPVVGNGIYMSDWKTGALFAGARLGAVAVGTVGTVRLLRGAPSTGLNIGLIAAGVIGYVYFKWGEITEMQHETSRRNEELVDKFQIAEADIVPGSIRYPTREWPEWITQPKPAREPQDAREAVDRPLPTIDGSQLIRLDLQIPF